MKKKNKPSRRKSKKEKDPGERRTFVGTLDVSKQGLGFVIVEGLSQDILVRSENMHIALDGDTVRVEVRHVGKKNGRMEGVIVEVITHAQSSFIGRLDVTDNYAFLIPDKATIRRDIFIPPGQLAGGKTGDRAVVEITEWQGKSKNPVGMVTELLSGERENEVAMKSILVENGFPLHFSKEALRQAASLPAQLDGAEIAKRKDCREFPTLTIDPADAKDFDDALSVRTLKNGLIEVGVHIADVSHYLPENSILDSEAYERATSVYFPDRVSPMLPERISNELCSLRPNEDKFTFSVMFQLTRQGEVKQYWIGRTVIHSDKRLAYEEAQQVIETGQGSWKESILLLHEIAQNLRRERFRKGAINFSSQEVRFQLDEKGVPIDVIIKESKEANQLIEEFMLLANRTVAEYVQKKRVGRQPIPFPYRIHDFPDEEKLAQFAAFASRFGYKFNLNNPDEVAHSFNEMLRLVEGKPEQHVLEQLGIRTMAKAVYSTENIGHYGLGFDNYCHFTSPIRRYPDVLVHRVVQECLDNTVKPDKKMEAKCRHCSDRERKAMEAERAANKYKQVEFMRKFVGDTFEAIVSGVASIGFWAETVQQKCEGFISVADLTEWDEFDFVESDYALVGRRTGWRFRIGDKVTIQVASANLEKRQIDFAFVPAASSSKTKRAKTADATQKRSRAPKPGDKKTKPVPKRK